jgi:ornithine cyclodeaminase/alanine dehydrogenase-like protein (mu-crystallin family)
MPILIREQEVEQLLPMRQALSLVEEALRALGEGRAENRPRQRVRGEGRVLSVMPASLPTLGHMGFKEYVVAHDKVQFFFHLFSARTGEYLAIIQADRLGQMRTGAASGVATKYLAREDAQTAGIIGTGWQAESQLEAVCAVRPIRSARCYSRDENHRRAFADKLSARLNIRVEPVDDPRRAVFDSDVVITITTSATPVLSGDWLSKGTHVNAVGSNRVQRREVDDQVIRRSGAIFVDSLEQARLEAGDLIAPVEAGVLKWERVHELGALLAGKAPGRAHPDEITLFKSLGLALEDVAVGGWIYERAREAKIGAVIEL